MEDAKLTTLRNELQRELDQARDALTFWQAQAANPHTPMAIGWKDGVVRMIELNLAEVDQLEASLRILEG